MTVDVSIYGNLLKPAPSLMDNVNALDAADLQRTQLAGAKQNLIGQQQSFADQQAVRALYQRPGFDPSTPEGLSALGKASPSTYLATQKAILDNRKTQADTAKLTADAGKATVETAGMTADQATARTNKHLQQLVTVGDVPSAVGWINDAVSSGELPQQQATQVIAGLQSGQIPLSDWKQHAMAGGLTLQQQREAAQKDAAAAETARHNQADESNTVRGQNVTAATARAGQQIDAVKADPYGTLGLNKLAPPAAAASANLSGDDYLATLPQGVAAQVKALANGKLQISPQSLRTPQGAELIRMAMQYDPGTDQTTYSQRLKTAQDFAPGGKDGMQVTQLNTAIHHAGQLSDAIDKLNNSNILPGITNPLENLVGQKLLGQTTQGVYKQKADALSSELRKVYAGGGGGSLSELNEWQKSFDQNASKDQQKAYLQSGMELLVGALQAKRDAYERGMGPRAQFGQLITPESTRVLTKLAPDFASTISGQSGASPAPASAGGWKVEVVK